jgi:outer membrane protein
LRNPHWLFAALCFLFPTTLPAAVTLDEAYRAALARNEDVQQAREKVVQAEEAVSQVWAAVLPKVEGTIVHNTTAPPPPDFAAFSPQHSTTVGIGVSQPIFSGFKEFAGLSAKRHGRTAAKWGKEVATITLYQEVAAAFLNVLALEQDALNLAEQLELYAARLKELEGRTKRGESNETEVLSARSTEATLQADMSIAKGALKAAREALHSLTGLPKEMALTDPNILGNSKKASLDALLKRIDQRPDVRAAQEMVMMAEDGVSYEWRSHLPTINLTANYYLVRPGFLNNFKWDVGGRITVPLFHGGGVSSKVREAISLRTDEQLKFHKIRRLAEQQIRSLHDQVTAQVSQLAQLKTSVELTAKNSKLMQRDYRRGLVRNIDVQTALSELRNARRGYDKARFNSQNEFLKLQVAAALLPVSKDAP